MKNNPLKEIKRNSKYEQYSEMYDSRISLAQAIYDKRTHINFSQQDLAKKAKTTQKIISKIENADYNVGFDLLSRIVKVLNLYINSII